MHELGVAAARGRSGMGDARLAELDAVTIDAYGTLVELERPVARLRDALARRGLDRNEPEVARAFEAEVAYYSEHKAEGRDDNSLAGLRARCASVFVAELGLAGEDFTDDFVAALVFEPLQGTRKALEQLRSRGLALAVVSNWDVGLHEHLARLRLSPYFAAVLTSAEVGVEKPDPALFRAALERLRVAPGRALHVGDGGADETGAAAAGMRFAEAPLPALVEAVL
jgi:HAD superfamily hydrolase (TIGR01509 family)